MFRKPTIEFNRVGGWHVRVGMMMCPDAKQKSSGGSGEERGDQRDPPMDVQKGWGNEQGRVRTSLTPSAAATTTQSSGRHPSFNATQACFTRSSATGTDRYKLWWRGLKLWMNCKGCLRHPTNSPHVNQLQRLWAPHKKPREITKCNLPAVQ